MNETDRPNILWICTDQQRYDTLGCTGNSHVHTPNIDRLAESGILMEQAYCQSPVCTPSRASFLTGRYPRTTRARQNGQNLPDDERLVTRLLVDAGYCCGLSGKLHLSACHPVAAPFMERRIDDGYAAFHWSHDPSPKWPTNEYHLWLRERGVAYATSPFRGSRYVKAGMPAEHHQTTWCAEKAITFMEEQARFPNPWLFSVNIYDPHFAFDPPQAYLERYLDRLDALPPRNFVPGELDNKPDFQRLDHLEARGGQRGYPAHEMADEDHRLLRAAYYAMVDLIDEQVGRMLDALDRTGQRENTLVLFMSDHGEMLGDHGLYQKGPFFYEPAVRVPLVFSRPGAIPSGRRSRAMVELVDLAPTLLDAAGLPRYEGMQGRSFWTILTGQAEDGDRHRDDVYCEYYNSMPEHKDPLAYATMIRTGRHKLVVAHGAEPGELYDLEADPAETHNLWNDPSALSLKADLLKRLSDRMAWTVDPLPRRIAGF